MGGMTPLTNYEQFRVLLLAVIVNVRAWDHSNNT